MILSIETDNDQVLRPDITDFEIKFDCRNIEWTKKSYPYLGIEIQSNLSYNMQRKENLTKIDNNMWRLRNITNKYHGYSKTVLESIYLGLIQPCVQYCLPVWYSKKQYIRI